MERLRELHEANVTAGAATTTDPADGVDREREPAS
jgi:hypothetical protein